jgi:hypothetical protein
MNEKQAEAACCFRLRRPKQIVDRTIRNGDDVFFGCAGNGAVEPGRRRRPDGRTVRGKRGILDNGVS